MLLSDLKEGQKAIIVRIKGRGEFRKRLTEMGFVRGKEVELTKFAPLKDPIEYRIMGYEVSLRLSEAKLVEVVTKAQIEQELDLTSNGTFEDNENSWKQKAIEKTKEINIALVGNPNSGKTTLFNVATGATEHVGNYSGVTVDAKKGRYSYKGYTFNIYDLPGTYSLTAYTPEEIYVRNHILNQNPDVIVNVVDASNLERNLYLTTQLIDLDDKVVIALNMYDELKKTKAKLNIEHLANLLGMPIVPTVAKKNEGIEELFEKIIAVHENTDPVCRNIQINYGKELENAINSIKRHLQHPDNQWLTNRIPARFLAIKLLEKDKEIKKDVSLCHNSKQIFSSLNYQIRKLEKFLRSDTETLFSNARYGFINGALKETYTPAQIDIYKKSRKIDDLLTHKFWGFIIFFAFLFIMFQATFKIGQYPMDWIDAIVSLTAKLLQNNMAEGMLKDLLIDGIINGVGAVIVFLPNIIILFFFISLMEDTGYMARIAFLMDKLMHKIGLHGKSFIPLLMGFGCNVPAIMSTRTIENRTDRILTMMIIPFMSCSARLPVYIVVIGSIFKHYQGLILFGIYLTGGIVAVIMAKLLKTTIFKNKETPFVMELPPYRMPTTKALVKHIWNKGKSYLKKMGGIILVASVIVWALGYFPINKETERQLDLQKQQITQTHSDIAERDSLLAKLNSEASLKQQEQSYIGRIGKFFAPLMRPLGFDWRMTVAIIAGVPAKEIIVSSMSVLFKDSDSQNLQEALPKAVFETGKRKGERIFTIPAALSFLVFILLYFPCIATFAAVKNETGSWKWASFMAFYTTAVAWIIAFGVYNITKLLL